RTNVPLRLYDKPTVAQFWVLPPGAGVNSRLRDPSWGGTFMPAQPGPRPHRPWSRKATIAVLAVALSALSACGSSAVTSAGGGSSSSAAASSAASSPAAVATSSSAAPAGGSNTEVG